MKFLCASVLLFLVVAIQGKSVPKHKYALSQQDLAFVRTGDELLQFLRQTRVNMNAYVDKMLEHAKQFMLENGLDPAKLPDIVKSFSATDLIGITWHGELELTKGWAQDLSTIYRSGDVDLEYHDKLMTITAHMGFTDLTFDYDYSAKIMNIGPTGSVDGKADQVQVMLKALVDLNAKTIVLEDFSIDRVAEVHLEFTGLGTIIDWIASALSNVVVAIFKGPILDQVEGVIRDAVADALANIDIGDFLPK